MNGKLKLVFLLLLGLELLILAMWFLGGIEIPVLDPKGLIAREERNLLVTVTAIMLIIIVPVYVAIFIVAYKFRASNKKAKYEPKIGSKGKIELLWWAAPIIIVAAIAFVTWKGTHALDPRKPIQSIVRPVKIQVVALQWKWLFLYPEQNIATVNFIQFPEKTPVNFELTSDAPMNSFWIPALSGQIYAMTGMSNRLHILADGVGDYPGYAAEISGKGFSGMKFIARSSTNLDFEEWVMSVKQTSNVLDLEVYDNLSKPSENNPVFYYSSYDDSLYNKILMKYMPPERPDKNSHDE